jgi:hypothetical protein
MSGNALCVVMNLLIAMLDSAICVASHSVGVIAVAGKTDSTPVMTACSQKSRIIEVM